MSCVMHTSLSQNSEEFLRLSGPHNETLSQIKQTDRQANKQVTLMTVYA